MFCCRGVRLTVGQRFNSNGGVQNQVRAKGIRGEVICTLQNRNLVFSRRLDKERDEKLPNAFGSRGGRQIMENAMLVARSWGYSRFIQAAHLGQLTEGIRRNTQRVSFLPTSAQSSCHRTQRIKGSPYFWETESDNQATRLKRLGVVEPVLLMSGVGRFRLFPTTIVQMRASSTAAAQKRDSGLEDTAAELKADQPVSRASAKDSQAPEPEDPKPNKTQQLKKVFKEYGAVGVSFHVAISLVSLGMCYLAISSGIDMTAIFFKLGFSEAMVQSKMAAGTSTFVLAYAVHKLFAPVRISITLVSVPLIVRYFRKTGFFKPPATPP
ncbi:hypothetical protein JZ751_021200 [Albula glossodonta]|uniref:DUF1279 domain-containing protein n=1 Tax=Albula glossodonta TaxID=121402 RepID=A0A8T2NKS7_9TELE|nr:hypothetical protein JZ751_021200 [Albula glossodonta]